MNLFSLFAKISLDDREYKSKIKDAESKFQKVGTSIGGLNKAFAGMGVAIGGVAGVATKFGMNFEAQMSKVGAISGASAKDVELLTNKAKEMGRTTKFSATESGQAFEYMAMAGWKTADMMGGIEGIMNLAAASGENLASVSDIVTDAMTAFGMKANEAGRFADVLAAAASNSNTNVGMLGQSFKYVAPLAGSLGYSVEDTAVALGLLANAGIKADTAGTVLRSTLTNMAKPTKEMNIVMEELGLSLTDSEGNMKTLEQVIVDLRQSFSGLTETQKAEKAATLAGKEAMSGLLAIVNASDADFQKLTNAIDNSNGKAKEMADTMNNNLKGSFTLLGSAAEGLGIAFYDKFSEPLKNAVDAVTEKVSVLTEKLASGELDNVLSGIASAIAGIGTAILTLNVIYVIQDLINVFRGLNAVTKLGTAIQGAFNLVMSMNPISLVIIAVAGLTAAFITLWNTSEDFRNFWINLWNTIKEVVVTVWNGIIGFFTETIPSWIENLKQWFMALPEYFSQLWQDIKQFFVNGWNAIADFFTQTIPNWISRMVNWFGELPYKIGHKLGELLGTIIKWGAQTWSWLISELPRLIVQWVKYFAELPGKIWTWLKNVIAKAVQWGVEMVAKGIEAGGNFLKAVLKFFIELPGKVWNFLKQVVSKTISWGVEMVAKGIEAMGRFSRAVLGAVMDLPSKFVEIGKNIVRGVWDGIVGMKDWIVGKVKGFFTGIVDGVKSVLDIHSPSRVFRQIGEFVIQGFNVGIEKNARSALKTTQNAFNKVVKEIENINLKIEKTNDKARKKELEIQKKRLETQKKTLQSQLKTNEDIVESIEKLREKAIDESEKTYTGLMEGIQKATEGKYESIAKLRDKMWESIDSINKKFDESIAKINEKKQQYAESMSLTGDLFKVEDKKILDANTIIENSKKETEKLKTFWLELQELVKKDLPTQLIEQMKNSGVSSIGQLQALNSMTAEQLDEFNKMYEERMEIANQLAEQKFQGELDKAHQDRTEAIKEAHKDYDKGLAEVYADFDKRLVELAKKASKSMDKVGKDLINGLVKGAKMSTEKATELAKSITSNLVTAIKSEIDNALSYTGSGSEKTQAKINEEFGVAKQMVYNNVSRTPKSINTTNRNEQNVTINQYYNRQINEAEAARLTRKEMRKLSLGVI